MDTVEIQADGLRRPRNKVPVIVAVIVAVVVVAGLITWGVLTHNRNQEIGRWNDAAENLAQAITAAQIVNTSSLTAITGAEGVDVDETILDDAIVAQASLQSGIDKALTDFDDVFLVEALADKAQSGAQSGSQSGAVEVNPASYVQSGEVQSGSEEVVVATVVVDPNTGSPRN